MDCDRGEKGRGLDEAENGINAAPQKWKIAYTAPHCNVKIRFELHDSNAFLNSRYHCQYQR